MRDYLFLFGSRFIAADLSLIMSCLWLVCLSHTLSFLSQFESLSQLLHFVAVAASIPTLQVLSIDGAKIKDTSLKPKGIRFLYTV